jgi:alkylation response protein AidB-like acyl-CoA dehydrogenase
VLEESDELGKFRSRYRDWLRVHVPTDWRQRVVSGRAEAVAFQRWWMRELNSGGWAAPAWPREYGGMDATLPEQIVMSEENVRADAPVASLFSIGLSHTGATLIAHGTPEQRNRHLPSILDGEEIWCQGFSEPNAGSDLASLQTRAARDGDHYVVNGQKVWSSRADDSDWCLLLARTDPDAPKRKGISYLLLDLTTPGIEIRPLRQLSGSSEFCEIFLTDVVVPVSDRVGPENEGWAISQTTLSTERSTFFWATARALREELAALVELVTTCRVGDGRVAAQDSAVRQTLARHTAEVDILDEMFNRVLSAELRFGQAGPESSIIKLYCSELAQRLTGDALSIAGLPAHLESGEADDHAELMAPGAWLSNHLNSWALTIAGGSNEIQRNLIGERVLGLPREPSIG